MAKRRRKSRRRRMFRAHGCPTQKQRGFRGTTHTRCRSSCVWCGLKHDSSKHRFHGKGAFKRTH